MAAIYTVGTSNYYIAITTEDVRSDHCNDNTRWEDFWYKEEHLTEHYGSEMFNVQNYIATILKNAFTAV